MYFKILILISPVFVLGQLEINIRTVDPKTASIDARGTDYSEINSVEIQSFDLMPYQLVTIAEKIYGKTPYTCDARSDSSGIDYYTNKFKEYRKIYRVREVYRQLTILGGRVTNYNITDIAFPTKEYANDGTQDINTDRYITENVDFEVLSTWSDLTIRLDYRNIHYIFEYGYEYLELDSNFGETINEKMSVELEEILDKVVKPGDTLQAHISSKLAVVEIEIDYVAYLSGFFVCDFLNPRKFQYFDVQSIGNYDLPYKSNYTEKILLKYYFDTNISTKTLKTKNKSPKLISLDISL